MATTLILSQHSSNPLEVGSSDVRNRLYVGDYKRAKRQIQRETGHLTSSDDPLNGLNDPEMEQYHSHISSLYPNRTIPPPLPRYTNGNQNLVDLDADMQSEEEFAADILGEDQTLGGEDFMDDDDDDEEEEDAEGDTDEEMTIYLKPRQEREEIEEEIADLELAVPQLAPDYKLIDRLGTGTFSSVYKAIDLWYHSKWDNSVWSCSHLTPTSPQIQLTSRGPESKVFVAVKRIYVTSGPERIRNEIMIMEDIRGCRNISQLITAFRARDQVVAIMPYHRNDDFRVSVCDNLTRFLTSA